MSLESYLQRNGINPDVDVSELTREEAHERAVETAYYNAVLSDSTYHGVNSNAKVDTISTIVKSWDQFEPEDFEELDRAVDAVIEERSGV